MLAVDKGLEAREAAEYLNLKDADDFRRSFKRWTVCTPGLIRQLFRLDRRRPSAIDLCPRHCLG
jgi:AraC-like DNA-binding protein